MPIRSLTRDEPALVLRGVHKSFAAGVPGCRIAVRVLAGVSLRVERGETIAVVGGRGSGKSTLLRCGAGLLSPDSGQVKWFGSIATSGSDQQGITYVGPGSPRFGAAVLRKALTGAPGLVLVDTDPRQFTFGDDAYQSVLSICDALARRGAAVVIASRRSEWAHASRLSAWMLARGVLSPLHDRQVEARRDRVAEQAGAPASVDPPGGAL